MTLDAKSLPFESSFPTTSWFATWLQASISSVPASSASWTPSALEASQRLWLPTKTACAALPLTLSSGRSSDSAGESWCSIRQTARPKKTSVRIYAPSSQSLVRGFTACGGTKRPSVAAPTTSRQPNKRRKLGSTATEPTFRKERAPKSDRVEPTLLRVRRIRLCPTPAQRKMLKEWMHTARATYNAALAATRDKESPTAFNFIALRNRIVPKASAYAQANPWALATPKSVRAEAIRDVVTAHKSNVAKRKKDASHTWTQRFRKTRGRSSEVWSRSPSRRRTSR